MMMFLPFSQAINAPHGTTIAIDTSICILSGLSLQTPTNQLDIGSIDHATNALFQLFCHFDAWVSLNFLSKDFQKSFSSAFKDPDVFNVLHWSL